jgi:hypothetical protein
MRRRGGEGRLGIQKEAEESIEQEGGMEDQA